MIMIAKFDQRDVYANLVRIYNVVRNARLG